MTDEVPSYAFAIAQAASSGCLTSYGSLPDDRAKLRHILSQVGAVATLVYVDALSAGGTLDKRYIGFNAKSASSLTYLRPAIEIISQHADKSEQEDILSGIWMECCVLFRMDAADYLRPHVVRLVKDVIAHPDEDQVGMHAMRERIREFGQMYHVQLMMLHSKREKLGFSAQPFMDIKVFDVLLNRFASLSGLYERVFNARLTDHLYESDLRLVQAVCILECLTLSMTNTVVGQHQDYIEYFEPYDPSNLYKTVSSGGFFVSLVLRMGLREQAGTSSDRESRIKELQSLWDEVQALRLKESPLQVKHNIVSSVYQFLCTDGSDDAVEALGRAMKEQAEDVVHRFSRKNGVVEPRHMADVSVGMPQSA